MFISCVWYSQWDNKWAIVEKKKKPSKKERSELSSAFVRRTKLTPEHALNKIYTITSVALNFKKDFIIIIIIVCGSFVLIQLLDTRND